MNYREKSQKLDVTKIGFLCHYCIALDSITEVMLTSEKKEQELERPKRRWGEQDHFWLKRNRT